MNNIKMLSIDGDLTLPKNDDLKFAYYMWMIGNP